MAWILSQATAILYSRYLLVITGFLIFSLAYFLSKEKNIVIVFVLAIMTVMSIYNEHSLIRENYSSSNVQAINYIKENIEQNDIIIYYKVNMAILNTYFPDNSQYFLNFEDWKVEEAYKAYLPSMQVVSDWGFLNDFKGRIWLVDSENTTYVYDNIDRSSIKIVKDKVDFETDYHDYDFHITLVEKFD